MSISGIGCVVCVSISPVISPAIPIPCSASPHSMKVHGPNSVVVNGRLSSIKPPYRFIKCFTFFLLVQLR